MNTKRGAVHRLVLILGIATLVLAIGCSSAKKKEEEEPAQGAPAAGPAATGADENTTLGDSDSGKAMGLQTVHFPYDSFILDSDSKSALSTDASILKEKTHLKVQIEGHCDLRGGIQYNIALGEKRANATKNYLIDQGVGADRMTVISFGKEKPVDTGTSEEAYAKNRRANFVITAH